MNGPSGAAASSSPENPRPGARNRELDGLRGWAALSVVAFHMSWEVFGHRVPGLRSVPVGFFLNGNLAVALFFVLSGEALSSSFFGGSDPLAIAKQALKRVPRLSVPILAATAITVVCQQNGWFFNVEAAPIVRSPQWLGVWMRQAHSFAEVVPYAFYHVYVDRPTARTLMPFLWTMTYEMAGSMVVFAALSLWSRVQRPHLMLAAAYVATLALDTSLYTSCFVAGLGFADLRSRGIFASLSGARHAVVVTTTIVCTLMLTASIMKLLGQTTAIPIVAQLLAFFVFLNRPLTVALRSRISQSLGRLSFPIYLMQFPVLMSFTSWMIVAFSHDHQIDAVSCLGIAAASVAASLVAAKAFSPVEDLTMAINRRLVAACFSRESQKTMRIGAIALGPEEAVSS